MCANSGCRRASPAVETTTKSSFGVAGVALRTAATRTGVSPAWAGTVKVPGPRVRATAGDTSAGTAP